jgi:ABC-type antimicrobial peptide transport system permease subunit
VIALIGATAVRAMVYGMRPFDLVTMVTAVVALSVVGLAASYFPAWRAAKLHPAAWLKRGRWLWIKGGDLGVRGGCGPTRCVV